MGYTTVWSLTRFSVISTQFLQTLSRLCKRVMGLQTPSVEIDHPARGGLYAVSITFHARKLCNMFVL